MSNHFVKFQVDFAKSVQSISSVKVAADSWSLCVSHCCQTKGLFTPGKTFSLPSLVRTKAQSIALALECFLFKLHLISQQTHVSKDHSILRQNGPAKGNIFCGWSCRDLHRTISSNQPDISTFDTFWLRLISSLWREVFSFLCVYSCWFWPCSRHKPP